MIAGLLVIIAVGCLLGPALLVLSGLALVGLGIVALGGRAAPPIPPAVVQ